MAKYRLHSPHVIEGAVRSTGEEVETDATPTPDMEGLDPEGKKRAAAAHADHFSDPARPGFPKRHYHK